jgi:hypothetical protein
VGYPSEAERRRLERFPDRIAVEDLRACFALSDADRRLVFDQRGAENRLGLAVALCAIRFLGFVPHDLASLPEEALAFVAGQVDAAEHELLAYGARAQTRSDHLNLLLAHLGWRRATDANRAALGRWLGERAVEHDAPVALMALAGEHLRARRVLRPPIDTLARMIATARADSHREVECLVADQLPAPRRDELDALLDGGGERSELAGSAPPRRAHRSARAARPGRPLPTAARARRRPDRRRAAAAGAAPRAGGAGPAHDRAAAAAPGALPPASAAARAAAGAGRRARRRVARPARQAAAARARARRAARREQRRRSARQRDELAALGRRLSRILLECAATGELPLARVEREIGLERLQGAAALDDDALAPIDQQEFDTLRGTHAHLRPAMHAVLSAVELRTATAGDQALLDALARVADQRGRYVDESIDVLPKSWRAWVLDDQGRVQRTRYELGLWYTLRDALRAGRVFRPIGRRYADPAAFLMPAERWQHERRELAVTFDRPLAADERLRQLEAEQQAALQQLQDAVDAGDGVRLAGDRLEVLPVDALPEDPAVARLQAAVEQLRPHVEITDVLADVDAWTGLSGQLTHAAGATPRVRRLGEHLHAALLAGA